MTIMDSDFAREMYSPGEQEHWASFFPENMATAVDNPFVYSLVGDMSHQIKPIPTTNWPSMPMSNLRIDQSADRLPTSQESQTPQLQRSYTVQTPGVIDHHQMEMDIPYYDPNSPYAENIESEANSPLTVSSIAGSTTGSTFEELASRPGSAMFEHGEDRVVSYQNDRYMPEMDPRVSGLTKLVTTTQQDSSVPMEYKLSTQGISRAPANTPNEAYEADEFMTIRSNSWPGPSSANWTCQYPYPREATSAGGAAIKAEEPMRYRPAYAAEGEEHIPHVHGLAYLAQGQQTVRHPAIQQQQQQQRYPHPLDSSYIRPKPVVGGINTRSFGSTQEPIFTQFPPSPDVKAREDRKQKDDILVMLKNQGFSYKEIKGLGNFPEAESTLRGRYRALTKTKNQRVRKPEWQQRDIQLLCTAVNLATENSHDDNSPSGDSSVDGQKLRLQQSKISWKEVALYIYTNGGSYHFGNATCKKKWEEIQNGEEMED